MNVIIVIAIFAAALFALSYFTKRRFGVLGLALTAGATLSTMWSTQLSPYVRNAGVELVAPPLETVIAAALILLPAVVLLFSGPTYSKKSQRIVGSIAFTLLAVALLLTPLSNALVLTGDNAMIFAALRDNRNYIVTAGILFALLDVLMVKTPKHHDKEKH